jgi:hypothetical protein
MIKLKTFIYVKTINILIKKMKKIIILIKKDEKNNHHRRGLNQQPSAYESHALTTALPRQLHIALLFPII